MRSIVTSTDRVVYFNEDVYLQERQLIYFYHYGPTANSVSIWSSTGGSIESPLARFTLDANNRARIDVTDYMRAFRANTAIYIRCDHGGGQTLTLTYYVAGLVNPRNAIIPSHCVKDFIVAPPRMIYRDSDENTKIELMHTSVEEITIKNGDESYILHSNVLESIPAFGDIRISGGSTTLFSTQLRDQVLGHRYAIVRWVSRFGSSKVMVWEVIADKYNVTDSISLISFDQDYNTLKGYEEAFTLFLDNLSAYDYWYYSDIVTSSKVEVSLDGGASFRQVDVATKSVTIPDGDAGKMNEIKVSVNYRKYDSVDL